MEVQDQLVTSEHHVTKEAQDIGVCTKTIPHYIESNDVLSLEVMMVLVVRFADHNMDYYPPGPATPLEEACSIFQDENLSAKEKVSKFLRMPEGFEKCFDLSSELPPGHHGRISASDWSGTGGGHSGLIWDFQCCTMVVELGVSEQSMFPFRQWSMEWLTNHCQKRFDYTPDWDTLIYDIGQFDDLSNVSRLLITNGINDGWNVASILIEPSAGNKVINFPNGAHHSEFHEPRKGEVHTSDIKAGREEIGNVIGDWLDQIREEKSS